MKSRSSPFSSRAMVLVCAGLLSRAASAQETAVPMELGSILGFELGSSRMQQLIDEKSREAEQSGDLRGGMEALHQIAQAAKDGGDRSAWLDAELAWVKLAEKEDADYDPYVALDRLAARARDLGLARQES